MQIALVTPYYKEDLAEIRQGHESVLAQDMPCRHIIVADGFAKPEIDAWDCEHIVLPNAHEDKGDFARGMGALHAVHAGAEFVAFLDADNWVEPNHMSSLICTALKNGTAITTCRRALRRLDGSMLDPLDNESDGLRFADTGTILFHKSVIDIIALWAMMPRNVGTIGDQIVWAAVQARGYPISHTSLPTLNYRTKFRSHYIARREIPPAGTTDIAHVESGAQAWNALNEHQRRCMLIGYGRGVAA
ncbi:glycosyltransferase [Methylobacterium sp. sgz302541]|uniref:glycosyltransferase n=1 Tax=unclassified Methylobacterium TaxID=2615210 RepID=UPI003D35517F